MKLIIVAFAIFAVVAAGDDRTAETLRSDANIDPDGTYSFNYETSNGISAQEQGALKQVGAELAESAQGSFAYTAPDGTPIQVQYVADENGFQPQGAHLPTPPPIPAAIIKALQYIAAHPPAKE